MRAHIEPDMLSELDERVVEEAANPAVRVVTEEIQCFAPARPEPTHRYESVFRVFLAAAWNGGGSGEHEPSLDPWHETCILCGLMNGGRATSCEKTNKLVSSR